jgi:hypothetical protein
MGNQNACFEKRMTTILRNYRNGIPTVSLVFNKPIQILKETCPPSEFLFRVEKVGPYTVASVVFDVASINVPDCVTLVFHENAGLFEEAHRLLLDIKTNTCKLYNDTQEFNPEISTSWNLEDTDEGWKIGLTVVASMPKRVIDLEEQETPRKRIKLEEGTEERA